MLTFSALNLIALVNVEPLLVPLRDRPSYKTYSMRLFLVPKNCRDKVSHPWGIDTSDQLLSLINYYSYIFYL